MISNNIFLSTIYAKITLLPPKKKVSFFRRFLIIGGGQRPQPARPPRFRCPGGILHSVGPCRPGRNIAFRRAVSAFSWPLKKEKSPCQAESLS